MAGRMGLSSFVLILLGLLLLKIATFDVWFLHNNFTPTSWASSLDGFTQHDDAMMPFVSSKSKVYSPTDSLLVVSGRQSSPFAYAFIIGGCNPTNGLYRGFIYNVLVATRILREEGSLSDVVVMIQMSSNATSTTVTVEEQRWLQALNIRTTYLPQPTRDNFYETVLNKFRVLQLPHYQRVMLMDGDVMPWANLDYFFDLSAQGTLKENIIVSGPLEPANGGLFVLKPGKGEYEQLQEIIRKRGEAGYPFDPVRGWGHVIEPPDRWIARRESGTNWTFHFSFSDQGLLYHWAKYQKKAVSIVFEDKVENWGSDADGIVRREQTHEGLLAQYSKPRVRLYAMCHKFVCDIMHFSGSKKPWLRRPPKHMTNESATSDPNHMWWRTLQRLDQDIGMHLDFDKWKTWQQPPLGGYATYKDMERHAQDAQEFGYNDASR